MMTDPISDLLTRLRNANTNRRKQVTMPASTLKVGIAQILKEEGFISEWTVEPAKPASRLTLSLKYGREGERVIRSIVRVSRPGRRVYAKASELPPVLRGMGLQILSTPKGVVSDRTARKDNVGGEILCKVT
jgi:small subunit ribosomal protein S8